MATNELYQFVRVPEDDPNRCQAVHAAFQCPYRAVGNHNTETGEWEGSKYCPRHGGNKKLESQRKETMRMYLAAKWKDRIGQQADHPRIKSLAEEIGIVRMMLDTKLNQITDEKMLVMQATGIVTLVNSLKDLVKTWQHVEKTSGEVIDRNKMGLFVQDLSEILSRYIADPDVLQMIGEDINDSIEGLISGNSTRP
jgi:hypothetical protein